MNVLLNFLNCETSIMNCELLLLQHHLLLLLLLLLLLRPPPFV